MFSTNRPLVLMNSVRFRNSSGEELCRRERALRRGLIPFWFAVFLLLAGMSQPWAVADPAPQPVPAPVPQAPPPAPPIEFRSPPKTSSMRTLLIAPTLYSIGDPTDEEQLYLELINRARADPQGESLRLKNTDDPLILNAYSTNVTGFSVDLNLMVSQFTTISNQPPLSMNAKLLTAARLHTKDMFDHQFQGHTDHAGAGSPGTRIAAQNYSAVYSGENVYAYAQSVFHGHAGFEVDWGGTPEQGGIQTPPGHRDNIHFANFLEVGIGVTNGINGSVGPQIVTQDFGTRVGTDSDPNAVFITGVAYYDFNNNGFYDLGEGIGGVTVKVVGENYYAVTGDSGGFSVPVFNNATYAVQFTASGLSNQVAAVVSLANSVKQDYRPAYTPPVIAGPTLVSAAQAHAFTFSTVGAATSYQWQQYRRLAFTAVEGAENGLTTNVTATVSPGYAVVTNDVKNSGLYSFHLAHPTNALVPQVLTLNRLLRPSATSQVIFSSRLAYAATGEVARCQISLTAGSSWQDVWTQAGTDSSGESTFTQRAVSLAAYTGQQIMVRFVYDYVGGGYYPLSMDLNYYGLYLDDISVSNAEELIEPVVTDIPTGTAFSFNPASTGDYALRVRAKVSNRVLDFGPAKLVSASPVLVTKTQLNGVPQTLLDFTLTSGPAGTFQLLSAPAVTGPWTVDSSARFQTLTNNLYYRVVTPAGGAGQRYYRIQMSP